MTPMLAATIAGVELHFTWRNPNVLPLLEQRITRFAHAPTRSPDVIHIEIQMGDPVSAQIRDGQEMVMQEGANGDLHLESRTARAEVAANNRFARVEGALATQPVDAVIRLVLARQLLTRGALLLHASALVREGGWGVVFVGPSGSGKSTLAKTLEGQFVSDEAVVMDRDGETVWIAGTPYWNGNPARAPLAAALFISRGSACGWADLPAARSAARLFASTGPFPPSATEQAFHAASELAQRLTHAADVCLATLPQITDWLDPQLRRVVEHHARPI